MVNITVPFPDELRDQAEIEARQRGLALEDFVRMCVSASIGASRRSDPLFAGLGVFEGDAPTDLSERHDDYLYGQEP